MRHQDQQRKGSTGEDAVPGHNDLEIAKTAQEIAQKAKELADALAQCNSGSGSDDPPKPTGPIGGCFHCCFVEGTQILMADGSSKPIEEVEFGDQVLSYDFDREDTVPRTVCLLDNPVRENIIDLRLSDGNTVSSSTDHPYWVKGKGWCSFDPEKTLSHYDIFRENGINVQKLQDGDTLLIAKSPSEGNSSMAISEMTLESIIDRDPEPTSLWILRVGDYDADWYVTKKLFEDARASGDFSAYRNQMREIHSQESSPHNHNFFANGVLVHNK